MPRTKELENLLWVETLQIIQETEKSLSNLKNDVSQSDYFETTAVRDFIILVEPEAKNISLLVNIQPKFTTDLGPEKGKNAIVRYISTLRSLYNGIIHKAKETFYNNVDFDSANKIHDELDLDCFCSDFDIQNFDTVSEIIKREFLPKINQEKESSNKDIKTPEITPTPPQSSGVTIDVLNNSLKILVDGFSNTISDLVKSQQKQQACVSQQIHDLNKDFNEKLLLQNERKNDRVSNSSDTKAIVDSINANNDYNNIARWDLPKHKKFAGNPTDLVYFLRHVSNKIIPGISRPSVRWDAILRNIDGPILKVAEEFNLQCETYDKAISSLMNHLITSYGNRFDIAMTYIQDFFQKTEFDVRNKSEIFNFGNELQILRDSLYFLGCKSSI